MTPELAAELTAIKNYVVENNKVAHDMNARLKAVEGKAVDGVNYDVDAQQRLVRIEEKLAELEGRL